MRQIKQLRLKWEDESIKIFRPASSYLIQTFEKNYGVIIPNDLREYLTTLNGTGGECTNELYEFYPIERIKKISEEFHNWNGVPNYQSIVERNELKDLFVIANFFFNQFVYAVKLNQSENGSNEVYILCGEEYKLIGNTFLEFLDLYINNSIELQFNEKDK
jgi:hypothetical protein